MSRRLAGLVDNPHRDLECRHAHGSRRSDPAVERRRERPETIVPRMGSVVSPAHNGSAVIGRCLEALARQSLASRLEVVGGANGFEDATIEVALGFLDQLPRLAVLDLRSPSQAGAPHDVDQACSTFPRLYLDADAESDPTVIAELLDVLSGPEPALQAGLSSTTCRPPPSCWGCSRDQNADAPLKCEERDSVITPTVWPMIGACSPEEGHVTGMSQSGARHVNVRAPEDASAGLACAVVAAGDHGPDNELFKDGTERETDRRP